MTCDCESLSVRDGPFDRRLDARVLGARVTQCDKSVACVTWRDTGLPCDSHRNLKLGILYTIKMCRIFAHSVVL